MKSVFESIIEKRRSYYSLRKQSTLGDTQLWTMLANVLTHAPSPANSQGSRLVLLLHAAHNNFWDMVKRAIHDTNPGKDMSKSDKKVDTQFKPGYGTVLFFYDTSVTERLEKSLGGYEDQFKSWARQESAMQQFAVWNLLEEAGMGASLQHYNPIVDKYVYKQWDIPEEWALIAQMPFGVPADPPWEGKTFDPIAPRLKVFSEK